jgi:hypothetical protein
MKRSHFAVALVLMFVVAGLVSTTIPAGRSHVSATPLAQQPLGAKLAPSAHSYPHATPAPLVTYPRTVLVETFTGVWCHFCPAESQALYTIDRQSSESVLSIAELHVCAGTPCLENYVPPDQTSNSRVSFYNVQGFPTVFFDGGNAVFGGNASWSWQAAQTMQKVYQKAIDYASSIPGNVSISQHATVSSPGNVTDVTDITSPVNATFNAVTYLLEYVNKLNVSNGYGPHDVGQVVRATLHNHPVTLVAGTPTEFSTTSTLNSAWNTKNLSVVTFVQQNSTKIVENANMVPVTTVTSQLSSNLSTVVAGTNATVTLKITNSSTGSAVSGAAITLSSTDGTLSPSSGVTASDGTFSATFTAPWVTAPKNVVITAQVQASGYTTTAVTASLVVNPLLLSNAATGLTIAPDSLQVTLNWTTPAAGGSGVVYHIYRSSTQAGLYSEIGVSTSLSYTDAALVAGHSYWYKVDAQNLHGFSNNTTAISATGVTAVTQGIPGNIGWWLLVDSKNFTSSTNSSLALFLPAGNFFYEFGPDSYAFVANAPATGLTAAGTSLALTAVFTPRYADLQGTVNPATAVVSVNGAAVSVVGGSFSELLPAGVYTLNVSATGYTTSLSTVTLTPGNATPVTVDLSPVTVVGGDITASNGGLPGNEVIAIIGVAVVVGIGAIVGAMMMAEKGRSNNPSSRGGRRGPRSPPRTEP